MIVRLLLTLAFATLALRAQPLPAAEEILKRVEARLDLVSAATTNIYHYTRTNLLEELDGDGKTKKRVEKTYRVLLKNGLPDAWVVAVNGKALSESEQRRQTSSEQRLQKAFTQEKHVDPSKPKPWLNDDVTDRFNFTVTGRTNVSSRTLVMLTFAPRTDASARTILDKVINKISGNLWVDEEEAEIALLGIRLDESTKFWGGIVGQLDRFDFTMRRERSDFGVWFNQTTKGFFQFRKLWTTSRFRFVEEAYGLAPGEASSS
jgi:hypothetical protein